MKTNPFAFVLNQLETHMPAPLRPLQAQVKAAVKEGARRRFERFDLVPRAQFDAQQRRIDELQAQIAALEAKVAALDSAQ